MWVYGYTCPHCDEYTGRVQAMKTPYGSSIKCPDCGGVEEIIRKDREGKRRGVVAR